MVSSSFIASAKHDAVSWARRVLAEDALILDFETTGIRNARIVQIGVIDMRGNPLLDTLVNPGIKIPAAATDVHGITDAMVAGSAPLDALYDTFHDLLKGRVVIAYNIAYEQSVLNYEAGRLKRPLIAPGRWECAMQNYARFKGTWNSKYRSFRWHSLSNAAIQQGIPLEQAHTAHADCLTTLRLIEAMAR